MPEQAPGGTGRGPHECTCCCSSWMEGDRRMTSRSASRKPSGRTNRLPPSTAVSGRYVPAVPPAAPAVRI